MAVRDWEKDLNHGCGSRSRKWIFPSDCFQFMHIACNSRVEEEERRAEEEELAPFWYSPLPQSTYAKHIEKTTVSRTLHGTHLPSLL